MHERRKNYLRILTIELDDLRLDIERLIEHTTREREARKLTNMLG